MKMKSKEFYEKEIEKEKWIIKKIKKKDYLGLEQYQDCLPDRVIRWCESNIKYFEEKINEISTTSPDKTA